MRQQSSLFRSGLYRHSAMGLLLAPALFRLWYIGTGFFDLAPDEAHYWEWSRRLDWSYYSKGPMVAYLIAASTFVCGHTEFCVRVPAVLLALGTVSLVFLFARRLFGSERAGFLAVLICSVIPLYSAGAILMTIDAPLAFFWMLALYALQRATLDGDHPAQQRRRSVWWLLFGCALGLGLQSKYTMALFLICLSLYMVWSSQARSCLKERRVYLALLLGLALFTPVILWNARHDWLSLWHVMGQAGLLNRDLGFSLKTFLEFSGSQIGVISPLLFFALVGSLVHSGRLGLKGQKAPHLFLFSFSSPLLAFFLLWSLFQKVQANWAAPAYLAAAAALAAWWDELLSTAQGIRKGLLLTAIGMVLLPGILGVVIGHFPGTLRLVGIDLPHNLDLTRRLRGWKELGAAAGEFLGKNRNGKVFLASDSYQVASELAFYVPGQPTVYNINLGRRMNQYDIWGGLDSLRGGDLLLVSWGDADVHPSMRKACDKINRVEIVTTFYLGRPENSFSFFKCEKYEGVAQEKTTY